MLKPKSNYYVETVLGSYLCELVSVEGPYCVIGKKIHYIGCTGRQNLFLRNEFDTDVEIEMHPPENLKMMVFVNIEEWPYDLPMRTI